MHVYNKNKIKKHLHTRRYGGKRKAPEKPDEGTKAAFESGRGVISDFNANVGEVPSSATGYKTRPEL